MIDKMVPLLLTGFWLLALSGAEVRSQTAPLADTLTADCTQLRTDIGGTINFHLDGGSAWAHAQYVLLATSSGPGSTPLPGGNTLPITRDYVTDFIWLHRTGYPPLIAFSGFLNASGAADATLDYPYPLPLLLPAGTVLDFCWTTMYPWNFQSNIVSIDVIDPPVDYRYDDGSTELLVGWMMGGDICWMHRFDEMPGCETIVDVQTIWGSAAFPGYSPGNGTPAKIHVWEDPTDDGDPSDIVLIASEPVTVQNVDTDIMNIYPLGTPVAINGEFYVGVAISHFAGQNTVPVDTTTPYRWGDAFLCGTDTIGGFDPVNIMANTYPPLELGNYWCLRAGF